MTGLEGVSIMAPKTGVLHTLIRRGLHAGKQTPESKKAKEEQALEDIKSVQRIPETYNAKGQVIDQRWKEIPMVYNAKGEPIDPRYGESINLKG